MSVSKQRVIQELPPVCLLGRQSSPRSYSLYLYQLSVPGSQEEMLSFSWMTSSGVLEVFVPQTPAISILQYVKKRIAPGIFPSCLWAILGSRAEKWSELCECCNSSKSNLSAKVPFLPTFNESSASQRRFMWNGKSILPTAYNQDILGISWNNLLVVAKDSSATRNILLQKIKTSFLQRFCTSFYCVWKQWPGLHQSVQYLRAN